MAAERNLQIDQGASFTFKVYYAVDDIPVDFTGWDGRMFLKANFQDTSPALALTTDNGGLVWQDGAILVTMTPAQTADLANQYYYDLVMTNEAGTEAYRIIYGRAVISPEVSR